MSTRHRLPLLALLWLLTAAGAGLLAAWLLRTEAPGERIVVYRDGDGSMDEDGIGEASLLTPPLTRAPASLPPAGPAAPTPPASAPPPPLRDPAALPPPTASVLVSVLEADGTPVEGGVVYALGAGESGTDDEDHVFLASIEEPGPVRLHLPMAGLYDIGMRGDRGTTLLRDFRAAPGDGNEATLQFPSGIPVQVRIEGEWPPPGSENARLTVSFWTEDAPQERQFPGRADRSSASGSALLTGSTGASDPLEGGRTYMVWGQVMESATWLSRTAGPVMNSPRFLVDPDRETVRPGETVVFRVRTAAGILVRTTTLPPAPPGEGKKRALPVMGIHVSREGRLLASMSMNIARGRPPGAPALFTLLTVEPGPCLLSWSGAGLLAGEMEATLRPGEVLETEIPVQEDPEGRAVPFPLPVQAPGNGDPGAVVAEEGNTPLPLAPEGLPSGTDREWHLFGLWTKDGEVEEWEEGFTADEGEAELDGLWRSIPEIGAVSPPFLATEFAPPPVAGPLRLPFLPAGLLAVVPAEVLPPELGTLRIRRADGRPIPMTGEGGREFESTAREVTVEPGLLLGPFPPGTVTFEVRLGGLRLPDLRATVVADRIEVLRVSR